MPPLSTLATRRLPWLLLLIAIALAYYGSYLRYGINFRDEGGTVALLSKRLLDGERPFRDVMLGYNVLWFYPVVGLYKLFGVNFVLLRAYCFVLSTITAVLAFLTLERASRRPWLAFLIALLAVFVPGMTFKNYMPLLAVSNIFCLLHFALGSAIRDPAIGGGSPSEESTAGSWKWLLIGAVVLGLTFLIRVDVGTFFLLLWLGAAFLFALRPGLTAAARAALMLGGPVATLAIATAVHLPVYLDASHRGFAQLFVAQYEDWPKTLVVSLHQRFDRPAQLALPAPAKQAALPAPATESITPPPPHPEKETSWNTDGLRPKTLADLGRAKDGDERALIILRYAPLFTIVPLALWAIFAAFRGWRSGEPGAYERPVAALLVLGGALTVFPQYFFFRSDAPHISEFSPGFWVGVFSAVFLLGWGGVRRASSARVVGASLFLAVLVLHAGLYLWRMLPDRWTGTIAARKNRTTLFHGENGVDVYVSKKENEALQQLLALVRAHSGSSNDYLVAYPYHPSINLLCDRRTYEKNVYVDNATCGRGWNEAAIARIEKYHPNVIVLSDWNINGTEDSRFSVWAEKTKTWIQTNYLTQGNYLEFEVYTRPEKEQ